MARGATVDDFTRLGDIPAFNVDHDDEHIEVVEDWRHRVDTADVVLVGAPEYAGGVAGAVKNAFDWLVGSGNIYRKPIAVISAGTSGGRYARQAMAQTLTWQGAYVVAELGITAPRTKSDDRGRLTDVPTIMAISSLTELSARRRRDASQPPWSTLPAACSAPSASTPPISRRV